MQRKDRRIQVLDCARRIFGRKGYHSTSVSDIIREAGIARGTFYLYFDSKRAIFDELLDELFVRIDECINRVDPSVGPGDVIGQLIDNVERVFALLSSDRDMTRIVLHEAVGLDQGFDRKLEEFYRKILDTIEVSLNLGIEMNLVRNLDVRIVALAILGAIKEVLYRQPEWLADAKARRTASEEMLRLFLSGLAEQELFSGMPEVSDTP